VICHSPFAVWPEAQEPWADVWVSWKERPGRPRRKFGPTLIARSNLEFDLQITRKCLADAEQAGDGEMITAHRAELEQQEDTHRHLLVDKLLHSDAADDHAPDIYVDQDYLDRPTAERMLACWLRDVHGIAHPKFEWDHPHIFVHSAGG
jgi:hypothetical protein